MKIRELFYDASVWIKGHMAKSGKDSASSIEPTSLEAHCWCLSGAARKCYPYSYNTVLVKIQKLVGTDAVSYNDRKETTFTDVKAIVDILDV